MGLRVIAFLFGSLSLTLAQGTIHGWVYDAETGEPIASANVVLKNTDLGAATDEWGYFELGNISVGDYVTVVSAIGYNSQEERVKVGKRVQELSVYLRPTVVRFPPLTVLSERMSLVGGAANLFRVPGSAAIISKRELDKFSYGDIHRVLSRVPGVNLQEEDGFGLRPNIGMRGTGVERSRKVSIMEDGVLIAPAPYSAPSAYYFPTMGRMESVEIRKGSSQIQYGPHTTGGALNLVSASIPEDFHTDLSVLGGSFDFQKVHLTTGKSVGNFGFVTEAYLDRNRGFKTLDGGGDTGYDKKDYLAKVRYQTPRDFSLPMVFELKFDRTSEVSNETYLGLADSDFALHPYNRYRASRKDRMSAEHSQIQISHAMQLSETFDVTSTVYRNGFRRNWYKLDLVGGEKIGAILADPGNFPDEFPLLSAKDSPAGVYGIKANNRSYESLGFQSMGRLKLPVGRSYHQMNLGFRLHQDYEDRFQWTDTYQMVGGSLVQTSAGEPGSADNRKSSARAMAVFLLDQITLSDLLLTVGLRSELIDYTRRDWGRDDLERQTSGSPEKTGISVLLPGIGLHYRVNSSVRIFGGIHQGFSPPGPRNEDERYRAEESVNFELGARYDRGSSQVQAIAFFNRHLNLLGADLMAAGGEGTGELYNGGEVWVHGLELLALTRGEVGAVAIPLSFSYTYTRGQFRTNFQSDYEPWGTVQAGDELPYLPDHQFYLDLGVESSRWKTALGARYTGAMRTRAGQGEIDPEYSTDNHLVFDLSSQYRLNSLVQIVVNILNATDKTYIAARRPAGVRPGLPRTLLAGIKLELYPPN